jgi:multidrug efflux system outer membrane protein
MMKDVSPTPHAPCRPHRGARSALAALTAAAGLALAGCTTTALPQAPPAAASAPAAWQAPLPQALAQEPAAAPADAAIAAQWWARFDDPLLPVLVQAAHAASPSLAAAATRIERARAVRAAAALAAGAQAGLGLTATHGRGSAGTPVTTSAALGVQASWELDLFGGLAAARDAAQARVLAARAGWHQAQAAVAAETASSYLALRSCQAQAQQQGLDADSRAETARLTELSTRAGFTAPADAALARAGAAQARSQQRVLQGQCEQLVKALVELTALPEPALRDQLAPRNAQLPRALPVAPPTLPAALLAQRPDVHEAARAVQAAAGDVADAQARQRPQVRLAGQIGPGLLRTGGDTQTGAVWTFGPLQVVFPVLDGGSRAAATTAARAAYEEAIVAYQAQLRRAVREVEDALVALHTSTERTADVMTAAQNFEIALRATEARQRGGLASMFELEDARRNAVQAQLVLIELQRERTAAWIALYRSLGGGWREDATGANPARAEPPARAG